MTCYTPIQRETPPFKHAPSRGRFQVLAYDRAGGPMEMFFNSIRRSEKQIVDRGNFEAIYQKARRVAIRNDQGVVLYDGPTLNALCAPAFEDFTPLAWAAEAYVPGGLGL